MTAASSLSPARPTTGNLSPGWVDLLYEISRQFSSSLELDEVLGKVLDLTAASVGASVGSIFLLDAHGQVPRSILARRNLPPRVKHEVVNTVMSKGFAGWVYRNQQADIIANTEADERWYPLPDELDTRSAMAAPLIRRGVVVGIITLTHPEPNYFTKRQLELLEAIAGQAASAVENAALYTRVNNERSILQAIIGGVQDIIIVTNLTGQLLLVNPAAQQQLALPEGLHGQLLAAALNEPALLEFYQSAQAEARALRQVALADGRVFDVALVRVPNVGWVLGMHDVTTFKRLDSLKSEFVAQVSHDLKAPLSVIDGYAQLLKDSPGLPADEQEFVRAILRSVLRMQSLITNLLDLSQIELGLDAEFTRVDVGQVAFQAVEGLRALAAERGIALTLEVGDSLPPVQGTALRLEQAVSNLVDNALKFTSHNGSVRVGVTQKGGEVVVRVSDTGPGILPGLQSKLFQKFSRLGQQHDAEGHGLGLSIVKSVAEAHGGRVWVESQAGVGSTFAFALRPLGGAQEV
ncbi:MAG: ATP-binding protein [Anaerolineales bacterium]